VQGPNGSKSASVSGGQFNKTISDRGNFLSAGAYTVSASGGANALGFNAASITISRAAHYDQPSTGRGKSILRDGLQRADRHLVWRPGEWISSSLRAATDYTYTNGADFVCSVPAGAGTFTIPPSVLFALPARNSGQLAFRPFVNPVSTPGSGLSVARLLAWYAYFTPLAFNKSWLFPAQTSIHSENLS
jgi:hypothetical protein